MKIAEQTTSLDDEGVKGSGLSHSDCIFCLIAAGRSPAALVYSSDRHLVFMDIKPINEGHILLMPRRHYDNLLDMPPEEVGPLFELVQRVARALRTALKADGINMGVNNGRAANQLVSHVHVHVVPRFYGDAPTWEFPRRRQATYAELEAVAARISAALTGD